MDEINNNKDFDFKEEIKNQYMYLISILCRQKSIEDGIEGINFDACGCSDLFENMALMRKILIQLADCQRKFIKSAISLHCEITGEEPKEVEDELKKFAVEEYFKNQPIDKVQPNEYPEGEEG